VRSGKHHAERERRERAPGRIRLRKIGAGLAQDLVGLRQLAPLA